MLKVSYYFIFFLFFISAIGCFKKIEYVDTSSGRPEVIIRKASKQRVLLQLVQAMKKKGYKRNRVKNSIVEFTKQIKVKGKIEKASVRFKIMGTGLGIRVLASLYRISNFGTSSQKIVNVSKDSKDARGLQGVLESIKDSLESYYIKPF